MIARFISKFPTYNLNNIKIYYFLGVFLNGWFIIANWAFFMGRHLTNQEIAIVDAVGVFVYLLMEVPSGALSDLWGKKKTIIFGSLLLSISSTIFFVATSAPAYIIANALVFAGFSFISGSTEAFAYDTLLEHHQKEHFDKVISGYTFLAEITMISAAFIGGFLYGINPNFPFIAWSISFLIAAVIMFFAKEPKVDSHKFNFTNYINQFKIGTQQLFSKPLRVYLVPIIASYLFLGFTSGLMRQNSAAHFGFNGETFGYVFGIIGIPSAIIVLLVPRIRRFIKDRYTLAITLFINILTLSIVIFTKNPMFGIVHFFLKQSNKNITSPIISSIVNEQLDSKNRATSLSILPFIQNIPYMLTLIFFANYVTVTNIPKLYLFTIFILICSLTIYVQRLMAFRKIQVAEKELELAV